MNLGEVIKKYRKENGLSLREFAKLCNISHSYIGALEKNKDPRTGKKVAPTIDIVKKVAIGLNIPFKELLEILDGEQEFKINTNKKIIDLSDLNDNEFKYIQEQIKYIRWKKKN